ncbi:TIGR03749 family integrating conjugative element protein [Legionella drancourtii]|uniref:Integrating conjugative element protein n=1 Tax=Legionella drancourtii LLAP12 TaxID=658187 RepID=G9EQB7_9GAMM|nr:TIGR03749 family integrating conjugative element protein [Legionella drancourtii]EHL30512.1 hypothetical protein LDG_7464 [Legionella drancourtii LLAP12]
MGKRFVFLLMWCLGVVAHADIPNAQHALWDKIPIHITLPLNQERVIHFPLAITIVDSELEKKDTGIMKNLDVLYFNAHQEFTNKRLIVQLMPEGEVIVLTVSASKEATDVTPIEVLVAAREDERAPHSESEVSSQEAPKVSEFNPVLLTRYAIQSLYSPERLLVTPPGLIRTPMRTHKSIVLVNKASVLARPLISWQGGDLYVTAVELKNALMKAVEIKPQDLIGHWQTASFYPSNVLQPRGREDTTTVFVVSDRPFGESLSQTQGFVR